MDCIGSGDQHGDLFDSEVLVIIFNIKLYGQIKYL